MVPDEEVERTTIEAFMGVLAENNPKPTRKKRKQVDPSSLVKNVKNETRIEKRGEGFVYEDLKKMMISVIFCSLYFGNKTYRTMKSDVNVQTDYEICQTDDEICHILLAMIVYCDDKRPGVGLFVNDMGNEVIDGYTSMLKREQEVKRLMHGNSAFFTSSCWEWKHYNSLKPRKKEKSGDPYLKDAAIVKDAVEKFMKELEERRSNQSQFNLLTPIESIFKDGAQLRTVQEAPQQNVASVDYGPIVCYIIKKIAELEEIPQKLEKEDVSAFRVYLIYKILLDEPRSWTKEKWQDQQLAQDLTSNK
ncbi:hypothetical protein RHGRI_004797 [Rhododendron griersonianum]|uniref:Uncharacterized protein n=1 Tax=Rhododendron griersonianum TaxID=479676 RepID=A0AAV6LAB3_9ERIC|nr:hypothetical protein RHGRI_004797 [Rhododendron griersonianum]